MHRCLPLVLLLLGCLPDLVPPPVDAAGGVPDADDGSPFEIDGMEVRAQDGTLRSADEAPSWPRIHLWTTRPPSEGTGLVYLLEGELDSDLLEDAASRPLRLATLERAVPITVTESPAGWQLVPDARLRTGAHTVLVVGWATASGNPLERPFAASLLVREGPDAGTTLTATWPPDGAGAVAPQLSRLALRFDGPVEGVERGVSLIADGAPRPGSVRLVPCPEVGWPDGVCAELAVAGGLAPSAEHALQVSETVIDDTGAPVGPVSARFVTAGAPDDIPPGLSAPSCAIDERSIEMGCVRADEGSVTLRIQASEAVRVLFEIAGQTRLAVAPRGEATLFVDGLPPEVSLESRLTLEDLGGTVVERREILATTAPLASLGIVEVRSDPAGREPRQEYVEVLNFGTQTLDLTGLAISDRLDAVGDVLTNATAIAPGQRALLVADDFDPTDPDDEPVPPGVTLIRVGRSLATAGITNAGEPLYLRDAELNRLSSAPSLATGEGRCAVREGSAYRSGDVGAFRIGECTPGRDAP